MAKDKKLEADLEKPRQEDDDRQTGYKYELDIDEAAAYHNDDSKEEKRREEFCKKLNK